MSKAHTSVNDVLTIGTLLITGMPETGDRVTIDPDDDSVETMNGTGGESAYSMTNSRRHTVTFRVMKSSRVNRSLLLAHKAAKTGGFLIGPVVYTDGSSKFAAPTGYFLKVPTFTATDGGDQVLEWVMKCTDMDGGPEGLDAAAVINPADY